MDGRRFTSTLGAGESDAPPEGAPLGGTNAEASQRLQIGLFGIVSMILLVGLASIIGTQADRTEESSVPEAAPTTEPSEAPPQRDPLADAGIVPEIPAEPEPEVEEGQVEDLPDPVADEAAPSDNDAEEE